MTWKSKQGEEGAVHVPGMKRGNGNPRFGENGGKLREEYGERTEIEHNRTQTEKEREMVGALDGTI